MSHTPSVSDLLDVIQFSRFQLVEAILHTESPTDDDVESLARQTEALRQAGREPSSNIGRRVVMNDGREGIITAHFMGDFDWYTVFVDGEEIFDLDHKEITEKHFKWLEDSDAD